MGLILGGGRENLVKDALQITPDRRFCHSLEIEGRALTNRPGDLVFCPEFVSHYLTAKYIQPFPVLSSS